MPRPPAYSARALLTLFLLAGSGCGGSFTEAPDGQAAESAASSSTAPPALRGDSRIQLLTYSFLQAMAEGVPCEPTPTPPLSGAAAMRNQLLAEGDAVMLVMSGDTTRQARTISRNRAGLAAAHARAEVIMEAMAAAEVDLFVPGPGDLVRGVMPLLDMAARHGVPVLASNLSVEGRDDLLRYKIIEHEGLRLACLGGLPSRTADGRDFSKEAGVTMQKPSVLRHLARKLMRDDLADAVVLFSTLPGKLNQGLCSSENLHLIIGSSEARPADMIVQRDSTSMLNTRHMGRELAQTTIHVVDGDWGLVDLSPLHVLPREIREQQEALAGYQQAFGTMDIEAIARRVVPGNESEFMDKYTLMLENIDFVAEYSRYTGSSIEHRPAKLPAVAPDNAVDAILVRQGPAIESALNSLDAADNNIDHATAGVLLPQDCLRCHQDQYEFWAATTHAGSHDLLAAGDRQRDASCLVCHAAGFGINGGYNDPRQGAPFGGVTCLNCHSPYRPHAENRRLVVDSNYVKSDAELLGCVGCHTRRRTPEFDRDAMLAAVTCPPMRPDDPVLIRVWEGVLSAVERQREQGNATDRDIYCEGKALVSLGREDEGFQRLREYASANTSSPGVAVELTTFFDERHRSRGAFELIREFLQLAPSDMTLNLRYVELLVNATNEADRDPELALSHLSLVLPSDTPLDEGKALPLRLLQVDAYYAAGKELLGSTLLQGLKKAIPDNDEILERLIRHGVL